jgi:uncharacterized protein (DUF1330 family)
LGWLRQKGWPPFFQSQADSGFFNGLLEGEGPGDEILAIIEFPSAMAARALLASEAYRPYAEARRKGATTRTQLMF